MKATLAIAALAALAAAVAAPASAAYVTIDLSSTINGNWSSVGFTSIPTGNVTLGGVDFAISTQNNIAAYHDFTGVGPQSLTLTTNITGATNVWSLLNTFWGSPTPGLHSVTFAGTGGLLQTFTIDGNDDIRDYLNNVYTNSINGTTTVNVVADGRYRLDRQQFALDAGFLTQTLTSITFNDIGADGVSRLVLTGLTVQTADVDAVPEPATWAMMIAGFGLTGAALRRRGAGVRAIA